jgi:hypothetical protein
VFHVSCSMLHKTMNLELSREQLMTLLECVHIASHVRESDEVSEVEDILLKCAQESGLEGLVMSEKDGLVLNNLIVRALHEEIDEYEEEVLWASLADELAARDLRFLKTEEEISALSDDEYERIVEGQTRRYEAEFAEHGADHLTLAHQLPIA